MPPKKVLKNRCSKIEFGSNHIFRISSQESKEILTQEGTFKSHLYSYTVANYNTLYKVICKMCYYLFIDIFHTTITILIATIHATDYYR